MSNLTREVKQEHSWRATALAAVVLALPLGLSGSTAAFGATVSCGQTLIESTTLESDLFCSGTGLQVGADGITLDLNGHLLLGDGSGVGIDNGGLSGPGHDGVTIRNGVLVGFPLGVRVTAASANHLLDLRVSDSERSGIVLFRGAHDNLLEHNTVLHNNNGIGLDEATGNRIANGNTATQNNRGVALFNSSGNQIELNTTAGNDLAGIYLYNSPSNVISGNKARGTTGSGISANTGSNGLLIEENLAVQNGMHGIELHNVSGALVVGNTANGNAVDGIQLGDANNTVTSNVAKRNGNLGIDAIFGAIDGGGNIGAQNGNPAQCTANVVCGPLVTVVEPPPPSPTSALPAAAAPATGATSPPACSGRAGVQTLSDPDAGRIGFKPRRITITRLGRLRAPDIGSESPRVKGVETTTYKVRGQLVGMSEHQGTIRLVVSDAEKRTLRVASVFPRSSCKQGSAKQGAIERARRTLVRHCGKASSRFRRLRGKVTIKGVGFFGTNRRAGAGARNGIELRPVISLRIRSCRR